MNRAEVLGLAVGSMPEWGSVCEFGVADGTSTRVLRDAVATDRRLYAFDSFEGLPEPYERAKVGTFAQDHVPDIDGVEFVVGWFDDTLTDKLAASVGSVALASLDADLYSSTLTALRWLTPLLATDSLLVFDEYHGENGSERRAHEDWMSEASIVTEVIGRFDRPPAGWGNTPEERILARVV